MQTDLKTLFLKALDTDKNYSEAHLQLALLYQDEKDCKNVEKHFDAAIISDCKEAETLDDNGNILLKKSQFQNAKEQFVKAQEKKNHCANVYYQQSKYFQNQSNTEAQQAALANSIEMNPFESDYYRELGILLSKQNQLNNAKTQLEKALDLNYADFQSHFNLGKIMIKMKSYKDAEQHFLSALDINPEFVDCKIELADLKLKIKKKKKVNKTSIDKKKC